MTFWDSPAWHSYEAAYGDAPGTRSALLQSAPWQTRVVDLSQTEAQLWAGVRRSYHALIHKAMRHPCRGINVYDRTCPQDAVERAHDLHRRSAGRETRPQASWDIQNQWLCEGRAVLAIAHHAAELRHDPDVDLAFAYVVRHGDWALYFNAASREPNLQHALQWTLMRHLKGLGVRWYELGWQNEAHTEKERNIEMFKRGFGGVDKPAGWLWQEAEVSV